MGKITAERLEAIIDAQTATSDTTSPEMNDIVEKAKIEAVINAIDNEPRGVSAFFEEYGTDLLIHGTVIGLLGMAIFSGVNASVELGKKSNLKNNLLSIGQEYNQWKIDNPTADTEQKKQFVLDAVSKNVEETSHLGVAFDDSQNDSICLWNSDIRDSHVRQAVSFSSTKVDCSRMDILASPEGETIVKDISEKPAEAVKKEPSPINDIANTIMLVGGATLAVGAVGTGIGFGVKRVRTNGRKRKDAVQIWDDLIARHDEIRKAWALYELDPMKMLDYPVLSDMREKVTVDLHAALRKANGLRPVDAHIAASQGLRSEKYEETVEALETAFHVAETEAKRIQWNKFSADEQKCLMTAKNLLSFVLDANGSEFERQAAYKRLAKEISGLLVLPDMTLKSLETTMRKMLTEQRS